MKNFFKTLSVTSIIFSGSVFGLNPSSVVADIQHSEIKEFSGIYKKDYPQTAAQYATEAAKDIQYKEAQDILDRAIKELLEIWSNKMATDIVKCVLNTVFVERKLFNQDDPSETLDYSDDEKFTLLFHQSPWSVDRTSVHTIGAAKVIAEQIRILSEWYQELAIYSSEFSKYETASAGLLASVSMRSKIEEKAKRELGKNYKNYAENLTTPYNNALDSLWHEHTEAIELADKKLQECSKTFKEAQKELKKAEDAMNIAVGEAKNNAAKKYNNAQAKYDNCYKNLLLAQAARGKAQTAYSTALTELGNGYSNTVDENIKKFAPRRAEIDKEFAPRYAKIEKKYKQDVDALKDKFNLGLLSKKHEEYYIARERAEEELNKAEKEVEEIAETSNATEEEKKNVEEKYNNAKEKHDKCNAELLLAQEKLTEQEKTYKAELAEITNAYDKSKEKINEQLQQELDELKKNQK